jgi:hypothetical protein
LWLLVFIAGSLTERFVMSLRNSPWANGGTAAAALLALASMGGVEMPREIGSTGPGINLRRGWVVGRDNGKDSRKEQPRNAECACGSGRKAKKCCKVQPAKPPEAPQSDLLYQSNAEWNLQGKVTVSTDRHNTQEQAEAVCAGLEREGLGGQGIDFPVRTWVSPVS